MPPKHNQQMRKTKRGASAAASADITRAYNDYSTYMENPDRYVMETPTKPTNRDSVPPDSLGNIHRMRPAGSVFVEGGINPSRSKAIPQPLLFSKPPATKPTSSVQKQRRQQQQQPNREEIEVGNDRLELGQGSFRTNGGYLSPLSGRSMTPTKENIVIDIDQEPSPTPSSPTISNMRKRNSDALIDSPSNKKGAAAPPAPSHNIHKRTGAGRPKKIQHTQTAASAAAPKEKAAVESEDPLRPEKGFVDIESPRPEPAFVDIVSPTKFANTRSIIKKPRRSEAPKLAGIAYSLRDNDGSGPSASTAAPTSKSGSGSSSSSKARPEINWRKKYEDLSALRLTKPEADYEEFQKSAKNRFDAADVMVAKLKSEVKELKQKLKAKDKESEEGEGERQAQVPNTPGGNRRPRAKTPQEKELEKEVVLLQKQVDNMAQDLLTKNQTLEKLEMHQKMTEMSTDYNLRERLKLAQELSGLSVQDVVAEDDGISYICRQNGASATASYKLTVTDEYPDEYQYAPIRDDNDALPDNLPNYLRDNISFEKPSAGMFFWRMCDHMNQPPLSANTEHPTSPSKPMAETTATLTPPTTATVPSTSSVTAI